MRKYPSTRPHGQPTALISPMSLTRWDIIKEIMKKTMTTPAPIIKTVKSRMNGERMCENPRLNLSSTVRERPEPMFSAKRSRKSVDPTESARLTTTKVVCNFLLSRSLTGNAVSLMPIHQLASFQPQTLIGSLEYSLVMSGNYDSFSIFV